MKTARFWRAEDNGAVRCELCPHRCQIPEGGRSRCFGRVNVGGTLVAETWGRPTAVIMRVVHIAPGPTPTLRIDAPAFTRSCAPSAVTMLPAAIGMPSPRPDTVSSARSIPSW